MNQPILCSGNDLENVLSDIRARKGVVTSLEAKVGGNAGYRVNYFERVAELAQPVAVRQGADGTYCQLVNNPAAINNFAGKEPVIPAGKPPKGSDQVTPEELRVIAPASGGGPQTESRVEDCHQHSILDSVSSQETPPVISAVLPTSPVSGKGGQGASRSYDAASMAVGRTWRNPVSIATPLPHCPTCSGPVTQGMACPICAGIERIKAGSRRLRNRFRSSTSEARIPYSDS